MDRMEETMQGSDVAGGDRRLVQAFDPPALNRRHLALANQLSVRRRPVAVSLGETTLSFLPLGLNSIEAEVGTADLIGLWLRLDGRSAVLRLSIGLFERILERIDPALLAADVEDELLPLLLESCMIDDLTFAEQKFQGRIELLAIERGVVIQDDGLDVLLEIAIAGEVAGKASLRLEERDADRLVLALETCPKIRTDRGQLKADLSFRAGVMWLGLGELRGLKVGDVLLADEDGSQAEEIAATLGERWVLNAAFADAGLTMTKPLRLATKRDRDLWMMVDNKQFPDNDDDLPGHRDDGQAPDAAGDPGPPGPDPHPDSVPETAGQHEQSESAPTPEPEDTGFDDLPIKLVFELGRTEISLGRLQEIGPGHVFEMDRPVGEAVEVYAGGRRIGQGEVVKIDEQVGVRMVRLFGHG